jgi:hypothetical protein
MHDLKRTCILFLVGRYLYYSHKNVNMTAELYEENLNLLGSY